MTLQHVTDFLAHSFPLETGGSRLRKVSFYCTNQTQGNGIFFFCGMWQKCVINTFRHQKQNKE